VSQVASDRCLRLCCRSACRARVGDWLEVRHANEDSTGMGHNIGVFSCRCLPVASSHSRAGIPAERQSRIMHYALAP